MKKVLSFAVLFFFFSSLLFAQQKQLVIRNEAQMFVNAVKYGEGVTEEVKLPSWVTLLDKESFEVFSERFCNDKFMLFVDTLEFQTFVDRRILELTFLKETKIHTRVSSSNKSFEDLVKVLPGIFERIKKEVKEEVSSPGFGTALESWIFSLHI